MKLERTKAMELTENQMDGLQPLIFLLMQGRKIDLQFRYTTDAGYSLPGLFVDDLNITADGTNVWADDAEDTSTFV
ncbi:hypothetical protein ACEQPO_29215 [Bacillus sp. SL00103]